MIRVRLALTASLLALGLAGPALAQAQKKAAAPAPKAAATTPQTAPDAVLARVDGEPVYASELRRVLAQVPDGPQRPPLDQLVPVLLDDLINRRLLDKAAAKAGTERDPVFQRRLAEERHNLLQQMTLEKLARARITQADIQKLYDEKVKNQPPPEEIRARHILVPDEAAANAAIERLKKGEDFSKIATDLSKDQSTSKLGGDLGFLSRNQLVAPFADAAFALKPGDFTQKPVKTDFGYHVIRLEERRSAAPPTLNQVRGTIEDVLTQQNMDLVLADLKKGAKIEFVTPAAPGAATPAQPAR